MKIKIETPFQIRFQLWLLAFIWAGTVVLSAATNVPPTPVVLSAAQRPGTTFMDIDYRVNDPDNATVDVAALGFLNGGTNFSDIIKISTLVEGTAANLGTNVPANTNLHLTWNVATDWNTNFGNVQVEILAKDNRGLLPFHWITLPAHGSDPELTVNDRPFTDSDFLPVWYWLIAKGDSGLALSNGVIYGLENGYSGGRLAGGTTTTSLGRWFLGSKVNFRPVTSSEINRALAGPYGNQTIFQSVDHGSVVKGYPPTNNYSLIYGWGDNRYGQINFPSDPFSDIRSIALSQGSTLVLDGTSVVGWAWGWPLTIPATATNVTAIAAGLNYYLALRADGTVIAWGDNTYGETNVPATVTNVTAIAAGSYYSLALCADGTVIGWGDDTHGQTDIPATVTNVTAIAAPGWGPCLALRADGTIIRWGFDWGDIPATATNITAIAAGGFHFLFLRADGTVIGWGSNGYGQTDVPATATNVTAIAAGYCHSLALRADGTVIAWGDNEYGQTAVPSGMGKIEILGVGCTANHVVVARKFTLSK
ncbi:MAG: hypothetical protein ABSG80_16120 [Verrucomicrobiota bacterium]|jgi:hypothetical protein